MSDYHPNHPIAALIIVDPKAAKLRILDHLRRAKMHRGDAAIAIGCAHSTFLSWVRKLDLEDEIGRLERKAKREGWHHGRIGGRPLGSTVENGAAPRNSLKR